MTSPADGPADGSAQPGQPGWRRWAPWAVGVALLALLAAVVWVWTAGQPTGGSGEAQRLQALLDRQKALEAELAQLPVSPSSCPPGQVLRPAARAAGAGLGAPGAPSSALPSAPSSAAAGPAAAPAPLTGGEAAALADAALAQRLEAATAIVLVDGGSQGTGMGTGFFISPRLIVTNRHVVEGSAGPSVYVTSRSLGTLRRATVLRVTQSAEIGAPDFALLRMEDGTSPGALDLAPEANKLSGVVAAGYPAVVVQNDSNFKRLMKGDVAAAPDLNLTRGTVQSFQQGAGNTPLLVHTASITKGNSGGPLVDGCGRVVGVNTFINVDQSQSAKINYAIRTPSVVAFVESAGGQARVDNRACAAKG